MEFVIQVAILKSKVGQWSHHKFENRTASVVLALRQIRELHVRAIKS